jgi:hypothetical protein
MHVPAVLLRTGTSVSGRDQPVIGGRADETDGAGELRLTQIVEWKRQLLEGAADVFGGAGQAVAPVDLAPLHAKIGQLALENDFLERALTKAGLLSAKP